MEPGPASSVVERSLRKNSSSEGTAVRSPPQEAFSIANLFRKKDWRKSNTWTGSSNLATSTRKAVAQSDYHGWKGNVAWINRSYDVIMSQSDVIYSTTQHYNNYTSNLERYLYALWSLRLETNRDDWRAMLQAKRKMEYEAQMGKRERGL